MGFLNTMIVMTEERINELEIKSEEHSGSVYIILYSHEHKHKHQHSCHQEI
jgi:hypothetical protein